MGFPASYTCCAVFLCGVWRIGIAGIYQPTIEVCSCVCFSRNDGGCVRYCAGPFLPYFNGADISLQKQLDKEQCMGRVKAGFKGGSHLCCWLVYTCNAYPSPGVSYIYIITALHFVECSTYKHLTTLSQCLLESQAKDPFHISRHFGHIWVYTCIFYRPVGIRSISHHPKAFPDTQFRLWQPGDLAQLFSSASI